MRQVTRFISDLFLPMRFYFVAGFCALLFVVSFFAETIFPFARIIFYSALLLIIVDYILLFFPGRSPVARRFVADRLGNGDDNTINIRIRNRMFFRVRMEIIDELPEQFQERNFKLTQRFMPNEELEVKYSIRPHERGVYQFGRILLYVSSGLGLVTRRFIIEAECEVAVYPSFNQLNKYQLMGDNALMQQGGKRPLRKIGQSMEFEQIKDYITGDDIRNINWKATARRGSLMVNHFTDERSQQVYCLIDKGRLMKMPFNGLTLLDYAINSSLVLSNVCLQNHDKIGLITFADKIGTIIPADTRPIQRENILQVLYRQQTAFLESDFEMLYMQIRNKIKHRSLLVLYTNFESLNGLRRQLEYLRLIAKYHLLLVVFFENTELRKLTGMEALTVEDVYTKTIAEKFVFEKKMIVRELMKHGILSILTAPSELSLATVNKYLELKKKQAI